MTRGGQIIRNSHGPHLQCIVGENQCGALRCGWQNCQNVDDVDKTRTVPVKCASTKKLSPVDPTDLICSFWTRNGEIRSTGLLLATFNKVHMLTY